jgi:hypothetical protein
MQLSFVETMRGHVKDARGDSFALSFDVSATGGRGGRFALRGLAKARPWAVEAPAQGTLVIAPRERTITYLLRFASDAGEPIVLEAQKRFVLLAPLRSMTLMPVTLSDGAGVVLARGDMSFDLRELLPFLASWLPIAKLQQRRLDVRRRAVVRAQLRGT